MSRYTTGDGKTFPTIEAAKDHAARYYRATGAIIAVEAAPTQADPLADLITAATEAAEALDRAANRMLEASDRQTVAGLWRGIKPAHDHAAQLRAALRPYSLAVIGMDDDRRARDTDPARNRFRDL